MIKQNPKLIARLDEIEETNTKVISITISVLEKDTQSPFQALYNISKELSIVFKSEYKNIGSKLIFVQKNQNSSLTILVSPEAELDGSNFVVECDFLFVMTETKSLIRL